MSKDMTLPEARVRINRQIITRLQTLGSGVANVAKPQPRDLTLALTLTGPEDSQ